MEVDKSLEEEKKLVNKELWQACVDPLVKIPPLNSKVYYFPQGHAEHANGPVDFKKCDRLPTHHGILCRLESIKYMVEKDTNELFVKLKLIPLNGTEANFNEDVDDDRDDTNGSKKFASFSKILTESDANGAGSFTVPIEYATTIFPQHLDFSKKPPFQHIVMKDAHGESWKFRQYS